ncbi:MAG: D-glycerate dehydrogenase [Deltaproteobacteria bacterium]|nr:D-glycerate dehydrogenase [Deltaproteobacteria bacterium]
MRSTLAERPRVLLTRRLPSDLEARLGAVVSLTRRPSDRPPGEEELLALVPGHDAVICMLTEPMTAAVLHAGAHAARPLHLVSQVAVGLDNVDLDAARTEGIAVTHTPGVLTDATADLTMALLLAAARRLPEADLTVREGRWTTWSLDMLSGLELRGAQLGIVGLGRIGAAVARRARAFGMRIVYSAPRRAPRELEVELGAEHLDLDVLLATSAVISLHAPLSTQTRGLITRERLFSVSPGAILVNTSRGGLIDEEALPAALQDGPLGFAALDVFEDEPHVPEALVSRDDVLLVPHIGSSTRQTRHRMAELAVEAVLDFAAGRPLAHQAV